MADELNANETRCAEEMAEERHQARFRQRIIDERKRRAEMMDDDDEQDSAGAVKAFYVVAAG